MKTIGEEPPRLVEDPDGRPGVDGGVDPWAIDLLRSAAPYRLPAGRKQRVRLSLGQSSVRRAPLYLRPVIVVGMLIGCGAFASAALGHWPAWMARVVERWVPAAAPSVKARVPEARAHGHRVMAAADPLPAMTPPETAVAPAPIVVPSPAAIRDVAAPPHAHHAPVPATAAANGEDTAVVLEAMRALRLERNPVRARVLLTRYLARHPTGTLAEEALAMSIEAAVAHRDADAAVLGARYLRLYPTGPFHALARQTQR